MEESGRIDLPALLGDRRWVAGIARGLVGEAELDDVAQDAWLAARAGGGPASNARAWLARVVRRAALQRARDAGRRVRRERAAARPEALPATDELVVAAELRRAVAAAVLELPEPCRTTVLLRYHRGLTPR